MKTPIALTEEKKDTVRNTLTELKDLMMKVAIISQDIHDAAELSDSEDKYPFKDSLKDTALDTRDWINSILNRL